MTKEDLEQIGKLIEPLKQGQTRLERLIEPIYKRLDNLDQGQKMLGQGQAELTTTVKSIGAGHQDLMEEVKTMKETMVTKADIMDLGAKIDKVTRNHERRIENLEEKTDTANPYKN